MATIRDQMRDRNQRIFNRTRELGIDMDSERKREKHTEATLAQRAKSLINSHAPTESRERQVVDNPPEGVMDGANFAYTLSQKPAGENIGVIWHSTAANQAQNLERSNVNPPPSGAFYWNRDTPYNIVVGDPPVPGDSLFAFYVTIG